MTSAIPPYASASLYVGDLATDVTEGLLFEIFNQIGPVASIRVCRDAVTRRSLGYAYVNFHSVVDAERAMEQLNNTQIKTRACRIMWSQRDPSVRKSGQGNIFIKNLDRSIDHKTLHDTFERFGQILSCKVVCDENGESKGYGFVHFDNDEAATRAIEKVNNMMLAGKQVFVARFVSKKERIAQLGEKAHQFTNLYVKNLPDDVSDNEKLRGMFAPFGEVTSVFLAIDAKENKSRGFGFVNFKEPEQARRAVDEMNGKELGDPPKQLYVGRAQKKAERESELRIKMEQVKQERMTKYQGVNLYVKNLDDQVDDERVREEFKPFGTITSAKVMRDERGSSRGFGFVCFSTPEEATRAVTEMNGRMIGPKPIYVALAQRKDVRRAQLEAQYARRAKGAPGQGGVPGVPGVYPGGPGMFYGQPGMAPQQGFVYPQQVAGGRGPRGGWGGPQQQYAALGGGVPGMPAQYILPVNQRGQPGMSPSGGLPTLAGAGGPGGAPNGQPGIGGPGGRRQGQRNPRGGASGVGAGGRGVMRGGQPGMMPTDMNGVPMGIPAHMMPAVAMPAVLDAKAISQLPTDQQKLVVGEKLYPLIAATQPELAGKITGMLLESYFTEEIIHLIETPDALSAKISEALHVLQEHAAQQAAAAAPAEQTAN